MSQFLELGGRENGCCPGQESYTSMAKKTCFPSSIAAQMIVSDQIRQKGRLFPEEILHIEL